jgi:hypothetical protein
MFAKWFALLAASVLAGALTSEGSSLYLRSQQESLGSLTLPGGQDLGRSLIEVK